MVTCQQIQANPQQYANQQVTLSGSVQTKQTLPEGVWLIFTDGTAYVWVWSPGVLNGDYTISGTVYENYLILASASPLKTPEEGGSRILKPLVVSTSSLAYGFGLYSLTLSFPPAAKTSILYTLPVLSLILGVASWFALKNLNLVNQKLGIAITGGRVENMWKLYPPLIISAFLALWMSPEVVAESATKEFSASIRNAFFISLAPLALSLIIQFLNTEKYSQKTKSRLAISLISVAIIVVPLLMLYPVLTGNLL